MTSLLASTQLFTLPSKTMGKSYEISISGPQTPIGLEAPPSDCPIVFVLDPIMTFGTAVDVVSFASAQHLLEPAVVVGVGYEGSFLEMMSARTPDLTPPGGENLPEAMRALIGNEAGLADKFISFLVEELAPEIRRRVQQASAKRRILFGHSLGGLFTVHALFTRPDAFETYCASSPSLWWNEFAVLGLRQAFEEKLAQLAVKPNLFLAAGAREQDLQTEAKHGMSVEQINAIITSSRMVDACIELAQSLESAKLGRLAYKIFDEEDHASVVPAALSRALYFALKKS